MSGCCRPRIDVQITKGYAYCEDCGGYEWWAADVCIDGRMYTYRGDGHLVGNEDPESVYRMILEELYDVETTTRYNDEDDHSED